MIVILKETIRGGSDIFNLNIIETFKVEKYGSLKSEIEYISGLIGDEYELIKAKDYSENVCMVYDGYRYYISKT